MAVLPPSPPSPPGTFTTKASLKTAVQAYNTTRLPLVATYGPIAHWDVSAITDMSYLFYNLGGGGREGNFNADISVAFDDAAFIPHMTKSSAANKLAEVNRPVAVPLPPSPPPPSSSPPPPSPPLLARRPVEKEEGVACPPQWLPVCLGVHTAQDVPSSQAAAAQSVLLASSSQPPAFDVDVVVTWVDATDAEWRRKYTQRLGIPAPHNDPRFSTVAHQTDTELSLCLGLLRAHLPWTRRTFIVTMAPQRPSGITNETVVHHSEMGLPLVFNSFAIESRLHAIPGLAERFIYLNDDVFVLRPLGKSAFFLANGMPIVRGVPTDNKPPANGWEKSIEQTAQLVSKMNTSRYVHKISLPHLPLAMTRRNFLEAERYGALREAWARTTSCAQRYHCDELIPTLVVLLLQLGEGEHRLSQHHLGLRSLASTS